MKDPKTAPKLGMLLGSALLAWAVTCFLMHGPVILAYVGLQAITSGIFAWQMFKIQESLPKRQLVTDSGTDSISRAA
ncbi:hypothetical protein GC176_06680 [bacterium]|nr:hypothetical protein [bacterium]